MKNRRPSDDEDARAPERADAGDLDVRSGSEAEPAAEPETERLCRERDEYLARWQRAQADYQNLKRRTQTDIDGALRRTLLPLLESLMLSIDNLDLALSAPRASEDAKAVSRGVELTRESLVRALAQEGVLPIPQSATFDPAIHEAVSTLERDDVEPGTVLETLRPGYTWRGQVLRPSHVVVARAPGEPAVHASGSTRRESES